MTKKTKEALEVDEVTSKLVKDKIKVIFAHPNRVLEFIFNSGYKVKVETRKKGILVFFNSLTRRLRLPSFASIS